jgi:hypothetical protein
MQPLDPADKAVRPFLGEEAQTWQFLGLLRMKDGSTERDVLLYQMNNQWTYPNYIQLHVVYQADGKWVPHQVYDGVRIAFNRIVAARPEAITLELQPNFTITIRPGDDFKEQMKRGAEINKPFWKRLSFVKGVPTLNDVAADKTR